MTHKEKAKDLVDSFGYGDAKGTEFKAISLVVAKKCALICVTNEYHEKRELLYNLKSSGIDIAEKVYLSRLQGLIDDEQEVKNEIESL